MRLCDRYLLAEMIVPFLIGTFAVLMMLVGNTLYALLGDMIRLQWPVAFVARLLVFNLPVVLVLTLPVATALAASLAVSRLARDNEITVLRGAGLSLGRAFLPALVFGALATAADLYIAEKVVPWAWREQNNTQSLLDNLPSSPVEATQTIDLSGSGGYTISFRSAKKTAPGAFRVHQAVLIDKGVAPDAYPRVLTARTADYARGLWTLQDVVLHEFDAQGYTRYDARARRGEMSLTVDLRNSFRGLSGEQLTNLSFAELSRQTDAARRLGDKNRWRELETNRWFKLALPAMCLPLALCAAPLALRFSRAGSFAGVLLSLLCVFVGAILLYAMKGAALTGRVPPLPAALTPLAALTALGAGLRRAQE